MRRFGTAGLWIELTGNDDCVTIIYGKNSILLYNLWLYENPGVAPPGFSIPFGRGGLFLRLVVIVVPVQPFTDEIGNHTSHDRNQKVYQVPNGFHPLPVAIV